MKDEYIRYVIESFALSGNFDALFGDNWIDSKQLDNVILAVGDYAFSEYGIDSRGKYTSQAGNVVVGLIKDRVIIQEGDEYSGFWFRLRPAAKVKAISARFDANPATKRIQTLGEQALERALLKIAAEDGLGSSNERVEKFRRLEDEAARATPYVDFFQSEDRKQKFVSLAGSELTMVEGSNLSNSDKAQARGFLIAAKALAETPEPPVDVIWTLLSRASSVAGIASFFVALIALIAMIA